jgi:hypothetical protein
MRVWLATLLLFLCRFQRGLKPRFGTTVLLAMIRIITVADFTVAAFGIIVETIERNVTTLFTTRLAFALDVTLFTTRLAFALDVTLFTTRLAFALDVALFTTRLAFALDVALFTTRAVIGTV